VVGPVRPWTFELAPWCPRGSTRIRRSANNLASRASQDGIHFNGLAGCSFSPDAAQAIKVPPSPPAPIGVNFRRPSPGRHSD